jgi:hypothetical protein
MIAALKSSISYRFTMITILYKIIYRINNSMEQYTQYWKVFWVINNSMEQYKIRRAYSK